MNGQPPTRSFTEEQAAARVNRTSRTIRQWISDGDLQVSEIRNANGALLRYSIDEADLLTTLRTKLTAPRGGKGKPRRHA